MVERPIGSDQARAATPVRRQKSDTFGYIDAAYPQ